MLADFVYNFNIQQVWKTFLLEHCDL